ncbi:MAG: DUF1428 domain-containing protein [Caulobacteraceae bacterium]
MAYIDGFLIPVPAKNKATYLAMCEHVTPMFREIGATKVVECWGDDVPEGKQTDFFRAVAAEPGESVVFAWVVWPDKATRDAGMKKMRDDPRMQPPADIPFDGKRMIFGGFEVMFEG